MLKRSSFGLMLIVIVLTAMGLSAQGAPQQINAALNDLSTRVGKPVALNELSSWFWEQSNYPDASLGCPQPGQMYAQVVTAGYKFTLTYAGTIYDYRVSTDSATVILCNTTGEAAVTQAAPTPGAVTVPSDYVPPCAALEPGKVYLPTRLSPGIQGRVVPGLPNNLRGQASSDSVLLGQIPGEGIFNVLAGPQCNEGLLWWQVDYDGALGWTVEGRDGNYWLEPLPPLTPLPALPVISVENAAQLDEVGRLQGNIGEKLAFSPDGAYLAVLGRAGSDGVWLYQTGALTNAPRILPGNTTFISIAFNPLGGASGAQVILGGIDGKARVWNIERRAPIVEALALQTHQSDVGAAVFAPNGMIFASAGNLALTTAPVDKARAILVWDVTTVVQQGALAGHTARVNALAYSPSGTRLASGGDDRTLRVWDTESKTAVTVIESPAAITTLVYSPNGQFIAYGAADGTVTLIEAASGRPLSTLRGHTAPVTGVAFSPNSALIATSGEDGTVQVWSTQTDQSLVTLQVSTEPVGSVAFSPDGRVLAAACRDHTVRLWGVVEAVG